MHHCTNCENDMNCILQENEFTEQGFCSEVCFDEFNEKLLGVLLPAEEVERHCCHCNTFVTGKHDCF